VTEDVEKNMRKIIYGLILTVFVDCPPQAGAPPSRYELEKVWKARQEEQRKMDQRLDKCGETEKSKSKSTSSCIKRK
jgi:hypothetical protein